VKNKQTKVDQSSAGKLPRRNASCCKDVQDNLLVGFGPGRVEDDVLLASRTVMPI
jgi:hypothetical protein